MKDFERKVAVITGAGSGIGRYLAVLLAKAGADVVICDVNEETLNEIAEKLDLTLKQIAYIGDDLPDLPVIRAVGLGVAVADAAGEVREGADYVTSQPGGCGALREMIELILKNQRRWEDVIRGYVG